MRISDLYGIMSENLRNPDWVLESQYKIKTFTAESTQQEISVKITVEHGRRLIDAEGKGVTIDDALACATSIFRPGRTLPAGQENTEKNT